MKNSKKDWCDITRCHHRLYGKRDARSHGEAIAGGNVKDVRVHVHVSAYTVASEALDNLLKHNRSAFVTL